MKDEELLKGLVEAARKQELEEARWDERFEALAASKLSKPEIEELSAKSKDSVEESAALELFAPFSKNERERIVQRLRSELSKQSVRKDKYLDRVITLKSRFFGPKKIYSVATGFAVAAILLFFMWTRGRYEPGLPAYRMSLSGQIKTVRGAESKPGQSVELPIYRDGSMLQIVLRPDHAVQGPVNLSVYLEKDGRLVPIELPVEWDPQGSARIFGVVGKDIQLPVGTLTLWMGLSRPGDSLKPEELKDMKASGSGLVMTARLTIEANSRR